MAQTNGDKASLWKSVVQKAWEDETFKQRLVDDPHGVLKAEGIDPGSANLRVVEDTAQLRHLVLPARPGDVSVSQDEPRSDSDPAF